MNELAIAYLARKAEGLDPIKRFAESYRVNQAGVDHDLVMILKGYDDETETRSVRELLGVPHQVIQITDEGFDISAYIAAAQMLPHQRLCFVNTFTEIVQSEWLRLLDTHASKASVGIVGATGSYESLHDTLAFSGKAVWLTEIKGIPVNDLIARHFRWTLELHSPQWTARLTQRRRLSRLLRSLQVISPYDKKLDSEYMTYWDAVTEPGGPLDAYRDFPRFPNPHIRSNCFLIDRLLFLKVAQLGGITKQDSYVFESGRDSLTARIRRMGLAALIVGRDGVGYDVPAWPKSRTFRLGSQNNVLATDNQVRSFTAMSPAEQTTHVRVTWGDYVGRRPVMFPSLNWTFSKGDLTPQ